MMSVAEDTPRLKLTYFDALGRAEVTRWMLVMSDVTFEDKRIDAASWPEEKKSEYTSVTSCSLHFTA